ncbi:MAG: PHP domain-containing protein [Actinobacteria bacterium]|nr:PHP domain-containing protein [Actinomycetota bacterium]MCA1722188.1 PHP domain-containing protein [Actinomycetota bacterium]
MSRRIDLHTHSTASDGTTPPAELVRQAREAGLDVIALTDHDTTAGWAAAADALPAGLTLVRGAEISCSWDGISLHLLAYLFDPAEPVFAARRLALRDSRVGRAEGMVRKLEADGHDVSWAQVQALAGGTVGRPHVAQALIAAGLVDSVSAAFTPDWIGTHGRYWVGKMELDALEAVRLVVGAGGVPVFAHPGASKRGRTVGEDVVEAMAEAGLAGLEVDHVDHDEPTRRRLNDLARRLDLFVTGSSDFHGTNKTVQLGAHTTSEASYEQVVSRAAGVEVLSA